VMLRGQIMACQWPYTELNIPYIRCTLNGAVHRALEHAWLVLQSGLLEVHVLAPGPGLAHGLAMQAGIRQLGCV
jgi:hypothetical protein